MSDLNPTPWRDTLRELTLLFDEHLGPRVRRLERRGVLYAMGSMLLFSASVVLIASEWDTQLETSRRVDEHLRAVVQASHVTPRNRSELGLVALLLANANQDKAQSIPLHQLPAPWSEMIQSFDAVIAEAPTRNVKLEACAGGSVVAGTVDAFDTLRAYKGTTRPYSLDANVANPPLEARDRVAALDGFALGPAACVRAVSAPGRGDEARARDSELASYIPAPLAYGEWGATDGALTMPDVACPADGSLLHRTACLLGDASTALENHTAGWMKQAELAQAYFVSTTGAVVVWSRAVDVRASIWREPMAWYASASTLTHFLQRPSFVNRGNVLVTPVYVDFMGVGLVRTVCAPVYRGSAMSWVDTSTAGEADVFAGTFCLDVNVHVRGASDVAVGPAPKDFLTKTVDLETPLFTPSIYCAADKAIYEYSEGPGTCSATGKLAALTSDEVGLVAKATNGPFTRSDPTRALAPESQGAGAAVLRLVENSTEKVVVLLRPKRIRPSGPLLLGGGGCFIAAMALAGVASRRAQEERARLNVLELLRSLPVGVAMLNGKDEVVFGNDRAEELLGAALPGNWEDPEQETPQRLDRYIRRRQGNKELDVEVVSLDSAGRPERTGQRYDQRIFFEEEVKRLRKRGRPYVYRASWPGEPGENGKAGAAGHLDVRGTPILRGPKGFGRQGETQEWFALGVFDVEIPQPRTPTTPDGRHGSR